MSIFTDIGDWAESNARIIQGQVADVGKFLDKNKDTIGAVALAAGGTGIFGNLLSGFLKTSNKPAGASPPQEIYAPGGIAINPTMLLVGGGVAIIALILIVKK